jgi:hypothetical protein
MEKQYGDFFANRANGVVSNEKTNVNTFQKFISADLKEFSCFSIFNAKNILNSN